jgi:hypothetical protein
VQPATVRCLRPLGRGSGWAGKKEALLGVRRVRRELDGNGAAVSDAATHPRSVCLLFSPDLTCTRAVSEHPREGELELRTRSQRVLAPYIEDTLLYASADAIQKPDLRTLAILVTWFGIHSSWVNVDRLTHLVNEQLAERVLALWSTLAHWQEKDRRFVRLAKLYTGPQQDLLNLGTEFQIKRHRVDPRFTGSVLRVPANVLRDRMADVPSPADFGKRHRAYHYRMMIGPSHRADMWAALERSPELSTAELARKTYGSFATAWRVKREFAVLAPPNVRSAAIQESRSA